MKRKIFLSTLIIQLMINGVYAQTPSSSKNYVMETVVKTPNKKTVASLSGLPVDSASRTIQYMDGLGRPLQSVSWQASPGKKDIVQHTVYDGLGRETRKYLPYAEQGSSDGSFKGDPLANQAAFYGTSGWDANVARTDFPYSQTVLEASPLNRVLQQGAPGAAWQPYHPSIAGSGHTARPGYGFNATGEVPLWLASGSGASTGGSYAINRLYKSISRDENWVSGTKAGTIEEFKDMEGRVVMKRVWETEGVSLSTHYIYDDLGNLRYVVPPAVTASSFSETGDTNFSNFIYAYHYDGRRRLVEKKIPGKGWEYVVYDKLDRVMFTQDAVQRAASEWSFTKYDAMGRTVMTGIYADNAVRATFQSNLDAQALPLWENRDNSSASGTGTGYTNLAYPNVGITTYHSISYYDDYDFYNNTFGQPNGTIEVGSARTRGLPTGTRITTLGTSVMHLTVSYYDADGRVITTKSQNHLGGTDVVNNTYNFAGELKASTRTHVVGSSTTIIANAYRYDHVGRKVSTTENINSQGEVTLNRLVYNEIGQLRKKSLHGSDTTFLQHSYFTYNERGWLKVSSSNEFSMELKYNDGTTPQFNGNIANQSYTNGTGNAFNYNYDKLNRLTQAVAGNNLGESISYDVMGNIVSLTRDGFGTNSYTGYNGNKLTNISGFSNVSGFTNGCYTYDANGNLATDSLKNLDLAYNHLNLLQSASGSQDIYYTYDATGQRLTKDSNGSLRQYIDGIEYRPDGTIDLIRTEEGVAHNNGGTYSYDYNLSDHLGNVRATFYQNPNTGQLEIIQRDDYYAFGLRKVAHGGNNKYLYNGKELQEELELYDYGARFYDPIIGRWNVPDPLAEKYLSYSLYNYVVNNPIALIDPNGMEIEEINGGVRFTEEDAKSALNVLTGRSKNVYMAIIGYDKDRNKVNQFQGKFGNGQWQAFGAKDFKEANLAMSVFGDKTIDNFALETHGGNDGKNSFIRINEGGGQTPDNYVYNDEVRDYNRGSQIPEVSQLQSMTNKVKDGGNFILAACYVGQGQTGNDFGANLNTLTGNRLNTYLPKHYVHTGRMSNSNGKTVQLDGSLGIHYNAGWLRTSASGAQQHINRVMLSRTVYPPVRIIK